MDYGWHYNKLIERAKGRRIEGPTESHHIIPRCMGGSDLKANRARLTPEEHFVAHQLLTKMHPEHRGLAVAAAVMATDNRTGHRGNNKLYGWLRRRASKAIADMQTGIPCPPERAAKISAARLGSPAARAHAAAQRGVPRSAETNRRVAEAHRSSEKAKAARAALHASQVGRPLSEAHRLKCALAFKGRTHTAEARAKMSAANVGRPKSPEQVAKTSAALRGRPTWSRGKKLSPEHRAKIAEAARLREARKRAEQQGASDG